MTALTTLLVVSSPAVPDAAAAPGAALSEQAIFSTVKDLTGIAPRATGSPGGKAAADYVMDRFRNAESPRSTSKK